MQVHHLSMTIKRIVLPVLINAQSSIEIPLFEADPFDLAVILYTSGTTGNLKAP
jgi:long-subunit acyl-CoA synthetase (AMP-forming)